MNSIIATSLRMSMKKVFLLPLLLSFCLPLFAKNKKIIALLEGRNEFATLEQCIKGLSLVADSIIYLDDASTDKSVQLIKDLQQQYPIEKVITKKIWHRTEAADKNLLLQEGRKLGGTHFIILDADELVSSNCIHDDYLRKQILALRPGDCLRLYWISLWKGIDNYNVTKSFLKEFIFCDDGTCGYDTSFLHTPRIPANLRGRKVELKAPTYGVLHFQFVHWENFLIKQAWYQCLEKIRTPQKSVQSITWPYMQTKSEKQQEIAPSLAEWFNHFDFFDVSPYYAPESWRRPQVNAWFAQYGKDYFEKLDIWDVDWSL